MILRVIIERTKSSLRSPMSGMSMRTTLLSWRLLRISGIAGPGFPEELPVALHDVSRSALDDLEVPGRAMRVPDRRSSRMASGTPAASRSPDGNISGSTLLEERDDLSSRNRRESFDDIPLGRREVVEDGEVGHPEVIVVEPEAVHARTSSGRSRSMVKTASPSFPAV